MFISLISILLLAAVSVLVLSFFSQYFYKSAIPTFSNTLLQSKVEVELNQLEFDKTKFEALEDSALTTKPDSVQAEVKKSLEATKQVNQVSTSSFSSEDRLATLTEPANQAVTLTGWLGETNGTGVANIVINLSSPYQNLYYSTVTDQHGGFLIEGVQVSNYYQLKIEAGKKYKPIYLEKISITNNTLPLYITLQPLNLVPLKGVVVDIYGGYVPNFSIKIHSLVNPLYNKELITDNFGRFALTQFPRGEIYFSTQSPNFFEIKGIDLSESSGHEITVPVDIGMKQISGWVHDKNGLPITAARILLDAESTINGVANHSIRSIITDETGYFEFKHLGQGEHYVAVYAGGFISQELNYNTRSRIDQLYFRLFPGDESLITSETLKLKFKQATETF